MERDVRNQPTGKKEEVCNKKNAEAIEHLDYKLVRV